MTHKVADGLELNAASHPTWSLGFLHAALVYLREDPDGIIRVAEHPEIVSAYVRHLLQVGLVDPRNVERFDELMW